MGEKRTASSCVSCYTYDEGKGSVATPCCRRFVCGRCTRANSRLAQTCIVCQLPIPQFDASDKLPDYDESLPNYEDQNSRPGFMVEKHELPGSSTPFGVEGTSLKEHGVHHYVRRDDSVNSLAIAYRIDASVIRKANHIYSDNLLQARLFILIPGASASLSSAPSEDEERKVKLKRFMVNAKCSDYDMARSKICSPQKVLSLRA